MGRANVRIKQKPEDFSVKESYRFDQVKDGRYYVYLMDKQKLSTFDAVDRIQQRFGLRPGSVSYCGLKDKQGRTEQLIAVDGKDVDLQETDLRLKPLGRTDAPLSARNITSNRFSVTVRDLHEEDLPALNRATAEVSRLGVVNYFDSQRFGSLKHGQGFIAKDLLRGDFEAALKNHLAKPSPLDQSEDAKVKAFWRANWGMWDARVPFAGVKRYHRILQSLRKDPTDYAKAFLQIDASYRAMLLFTYQSYLWNEAARRYLQLVLGREDLFPAPYQAGTILFHRGAPPEVQRKLRDQTFPLLAPDSKIEDPQILEAVNWILGKEKTTLEGLKVPQVGGRLFFKHEERPLLVFPDKLVVGRVMPDELNRGSLKVNVAFTLPPGAYATLVIKRLFHFSWHEETHEDVRASQRQAAAYAAERAAEREGWDDEDEDEDDGLAAGPRARTGAAPHLGARSPSPRPRRGPTAAYVEAPVAAPKRALTFEGKPGSRPARTSNDARPERALAGRGRTARGDEAPARGARPERTPSRPTRGEGAERSPRAASASRPARDSEAREPRRTPRDGDAPRASRPARDSEAREPRRTSRDGDAPRASRPPRDTDAPRRNDGEAAPRKRPDARAATGPAAKEAPLKASRPAAEPASEEATLAPGQHLSPKKPPRGAKAGDRSRGKSKQPKTKAKPKGKGKPGKRATR